LTTRTSCPVPRATPKGTRRCPRGPRNRSGVTASGTGTTLTLDGNGDGTFESSGAPGDTFVTTYNTAGTFTAAAPAPVADAAENPRAQEDKDFEDQILAVLQTGSRKEAIHRYMALTGEAEDQARHVVDHIAMTNGIQKKGRCFIATACYGSYDAPEVQVLRRFRNERLLPSPAGAGLVRLYYWLSPPLARAIAERPLWQKGVRRLLALVVRLVGVPGNE